MRQSALETFYNTLEGQDLSSLDVADFGGQNRVVLIKRDKRKASVANPLNAFKSYCSFNVAHNPDRVFDLTIPLPSEEKNSYDMVLSFDTLEHVKYPSSFCKNMVAAVKPEGLIYLSTVFAWPYHSSKDYFRFSPDGLRICFENLPINTIQCDWDLDDRYLKKQTGVFYFGKKMKFSGEDT